jgi:hypothetical protein
MRIAACHSHGDPSPWGEILCKFAHFFIARPEAGM